MIINCCKGRKGYTLIELMLAMGLFVSLAGGLGYAIVRGVNAHNFESSYREATFQTRNVLNQMLEELRTACVPEEAVAWGDNERAIPSPVWIPNAYGVEETFGDSFYKQDIKTLTLGGRSRKPHIAHNRLIFTRKDPNNGAYVFVDWFVPSNKRNRIYRIVHTFPTASTGGTNNCFSFSSNRYKLTASFFGNGSTTWGSNIYNSEQDASLNTNVNNFIVAQLPGGFDRFSFVVEHDPNTNGYSGAEDILTGGVADRNGATYNPSLFRVVIKATVYDAKSGSNLNNDGTTYGENSKNKLYEASDEDPYATLNDKSVRGNSHKRVVIYNEQAYTKH